MEGEKGKKDFHLIVQQLENCCHLFCLSFAENGKKNVEKFGEINLNTLVGTLTLPSTSHPSRFASTSSLGPGATVDLGLGLVGVVLGPCWAVLVRSGLGPLLD